MSNTKWPQWMVWDRGSISDDLIRPTLDARAKQLLADNPELASIHVTYPAIGVDGTAAENVARFDPGGRGA